MQPVDVLRPLALGQLPLRPGEREVELAVEGLLRRRHGDDFHASLELLGRLAPAGVDVLGLLGELECDAAAAERPARRPDRDERSRVIGWLAGEAAPAARAREPA